MQVRGIAAVVATAALASATPISAAPPVSGYTLAYQDEFNAAAVNTADWYYRIIMSYKRANGYVSRDNASQANGLLRLRYTRQDVDGDGALDYVGAGIISRKLFGYGYYEVRARLFGATKGLHTSFWSMGVTKGLESAGEDPAITQDINNSQMPEYNQLWELDGFEHDSPNGIDMGTVAHSTNADACRLKSSNGGSYLTAAQMGIASFADWHVYGYEYTPTQIKFFVDGDLKYTMDLSSCRNIYYPMNFWLTALPYPAGVTGINNSVLPGVSEFDYFRYYTRPHTGANLLGNASFDAVRPEPESLLASAGWIEAFDKGASRLEEAFPFNGTRRLLHKAAVPYRVTTKQDLEYIPNGTYTLTAHMKSSGGQTRAEMRVLNHGGTERKVTAPTTDAWTPVTINDVEVTANKATIALTSEASANQYMIVDNVVFRRQ